MDSAFDSDARGALIAAFLSDVGWGDAELSWLGQDASSRRYARIRAGTQRAMLMDAPPVEALPCPPGADAQTRSQLGWNAMTRLAASRVEAFAALSDWLRGNGLSAPQVLALNIEAGLALIEDFGEGLEFARLIERGDQDEVTLYTAAAEVLAHLHDIAAPISVPVPAPVPVPNLGPTSAPCDWPILVFDEVALGANADLYADWLPQMAGQPALGGALRTQWQAARDDLIAQACAFPRALTLRDYHAENLLWLSDRGGVARVGLLDFQDAVLGWDAWDLAMLTQDARRPVSPEAAEAAITRYLDLTGGDRAAFDARLAVIGTLNALRISGVFARLMIRDGKPRYGAFQPRQLSILAQNLEHPATAQMAALVKQATPFVFEATP